MYLLLLSRKSGYEVRYCRALCHPSKVLCPPPQKPDSPGDQNYNCRRNWKSRFKRIWPLLDNWKWCQTTVIKWLLLCNKAVNPDKCIFFTRLVLVGLGATVSLFDLTILRERNASTKNVTVLIKSKSPSPETNPSLQLSAIPKDYQLPKGHFLRICASPKAVLAPPSSPIKIGERWNLKNLSLRLLSPNVVLMEPFFAMFIPSYMI